jgi:hypothetical protein
MEVGPEGSNSSSLRRDHSQTASREALDAAIYSASVDEPACSTRSSFITLFNIHYYFRTMYI